MNLIPLYEHIIWNICHSICMTHSAKTGGMENMNDAGLLYIHLNPIKQ